jgi:hypothetical protein
MDRVFQYIDAHRDESSNLWGWAVHLRRSLLGH